MTPVALTIAGSDPSGGAGLQADLKTFHQFDVYGESAATLIAVQNTRGVTRVHRLPADVVADQIRAVLQDIPPQAAKTGALGSKEVVASVAEIAAGWTFPVVIDPVMISKGGARLLDEAAVRTLIDGLIPRAFLLMPNLDEAAALTGWTVKDRESMIRAAEKLIAMGAANVLVKGGHLEGDALDILVTGGLVTGGLVTGGLVTGAAVAKDPAAGRPAPAAHTVHEFTSARIATRHTHGSGCTYSAAITAELAKGMELLEAVRRAKDFVTRAILTNPGLGAGQGPLNHHA